MNLTYFRDKKTVYDLAGIIKERVEGQNFTFMHVCGTHEYSIVKYGLREILPESIQLISGPGCPVCVCPVADIDFAIELIIQKKVLLATYGDMIRVPGTQYNLDQIRAQYGSIEIVTGPLDAVELARNHPERNVVFFSIGFETTVSGVASIMTHDLPDNFFLLPSHRIVPPALVALLQMKEQMSDIMIDGFILPGHVSTIIGTDAYHALSDEFGVASAVAGFDPVDIMYGIELILKQLKESHYFVGNAYSRLVSPQGNTKALEMMETVFEVKDSIWRGIGVIPNSGLFLKETYQSHDAIRRFPEVYEAVMGANDKDIKPGCICHRVILGAQKPNECALFNKGCSPEHPYGPCMVSMEGTCRIWSVYELDQRGK